MWVTTEAVAYLITEKGGHENGGTDDEQDCSDYHDYLFLYPFLTDIHLDVYLQARYHSNNSGNSIGQTDDIEKHGNHEVVRLGKTTLNKH